MNPRKKLNIKRNRRAARTGATVFGTAERPRLSVHRTNRYFYAQLIDDEKGRTIVAATNAVKSSMKSAKVAKSASAFSMGELLAKKAMEKGITKAVFDRGAYKFHGRVKSFADGVKKAGLTI
ncbi:MAG TPA: 50S ribosomal protein L18 [Candidatus Paceibacterota bacterium]|nr:50S ribosomal protein L18 [Candidatus Paceibacterota bacterium]